MFSSVQSSCSVLSDALRLQGMQHDGLPCPSPTLAGLSNFMSIESMMPSNHLILCHPLLLLTSIFPSIRVFSMSQFFTSGSQSTEVSASVSVLSMNIQDWFPLGFTVWFSGNSKDSKGSFQTPKFKIITFSVLSFLYNQISHPYLTTGKTIA